MRGDLENFGALVNKGRRRDDAHSNTCCCPPPGKGLIFVCMFEERSESDHPTISFLSSCKLHSNVTEFV